MVRVRPGQGYYWLGRWWYTRRCPCPVCPKGTVPVNTPATAEARLDLSEVALDGPLKNMAQAWAIAKVLAQSSMVPHALRGSPQNCLVTMMLGQELDLTWTQATRGIYVLPNGTPGLRGQLLLALIRKRGHRYAFERGENFCKCVITRKDEDFKIPYEGAFNLDDALLAGLVTEKDGKMFARSQQGNPLPWEQYRRDMLQWRAVARAAGIGAPEVIYGFDIAGIGDGNAEGAAVGAAPGPVPPGGTGPGQVFTAEVVDDTKGKLAELNEQMASGPAETNGDADYDTRFQGGSGVSGKTAQASPAASSPPGYDDLDQLLKRSGFHGDAQADLVSALVHRDVRGLAELTKGEVLIAHDVITKAIRGASTVGARRAALSVLAAAERDAMESSAGEAGEWDGG